jgi:2-polyprenyl-6-methoxyphenol hydroxylase-like FAD-dependent oxidoreductase
MRPRPADVDQGSHGRAGERTCDVVVVGGGPCGLFLAALLARDGVHVVVLERRPEPSTHSRAIGLHPPALAALHTLGLEEQALSEAVVIRGGVARSRRRELGRLTFERAWPERPFVLALPQHRTEALLTQELAAVSPGALHRGWEVEDVEQDGSGVAVGATQAQVGGPAAHATQACVTWRAQVVVGADGPQSLVRHRAGITSRARTYRDTYLMGDFRDDTEDGTTAVLYVESGGIVESFPLPGQVRRWVAHTGRAGAEQSPEVLAGLVAGRTGQVLDIASCTMVSAFSVRRRIAGRMVAGRSVLVGDAAHEISPIGGQGMTLGWLDALALAPLLAQRVRSGAAGPLEEVPAFRAVERTRLAAARRAARRAELNMAAGRPVPALAGRLRDGAVRGVLALPLRHALARAFTMRAL